ncbi:MAG TPA: bacterial transcriptional activator domain-containing protein [Pyrinomonadaceae bacterium]|nr:bacterial transcriptional activator domain-containing protein [Pyrinomonadaceae bacterium]
MRNNRLSTFALMIALLLLATPRAVAQDVTPEALGGETAELCNRAPLAGADKVYVVVRENDDVQLVGMRGRDAVWKKSFPLREDVNKAKTYVQCQAKVVELHSQLPFSAAEVIQTFSWNGLRLNYIATRHEDPSAEFIEEMIRAAERGDTKTLRPFLENNPAEGTVDVMYPYAYINRRLFADAIKRGHNAATRLFKQGRAREAALRLSMMFDVTEELNQIVSADEPLKESPARWLAAWKAQELERGDYVYALNDYGFFLQQAGDHSRAVETFTAIIGIDPARAVAYLNLADSLWTLDRKGEARAHYRNYQRLMTGASRQGGIPARVAERLNRA